jgi:hypothetical protein
MTAPEETTHATSETDGDLVHIICVGCYPDELPGPMLALCGVIEVGEWIDAWPVPNDCIVCAHTPRCPVCGQPNGEYGWY